MENMSQLFFWIFDNFKQLQSMKVGKFAVVSGSWTSNWRNWNPFGRFSRTVSWISNNLSVGFSSLTSATVKSIVWLLVRGLGFPRSVTIKMISKVFSSMASKSSDSSSTIIASPSMLESGINGPLTTALSVQLVQSARIHVWFVTFVRWSLAKVFWIFRLHYFNCQ